MKSLSELIAHFKKRAKECAAERDRCNDQVPGPTISEKEHAGFVAIWEEERQIARDTAAWLETIAKRAT